MLKVDFPTLEKTKKRRRLHFPPLGKMRKPENRSSLVSEMQKTPKTAFRLQRQAENAENRSSLVSETQKLQKNARRRSTKYEKHRKQPIVGRRNTKNTENSLLSADETRKTLKTARRRPTKC